MKILAIGDFHGKFPAKLKKIAKRKDIDLVLCTGDLGGSDKLLKILFKYMDKNWWKEIGPEKTRQYVLEDYDSGKKIIKELNLLNKKIYMIPGNWDFTSKTFLKRTGGLILSKYQDLIKKKKNLHWWNRGLKRLDGLNILAFGGMVTAGAYLKKNKVFSKKQKNKYIKKNKKETKQIMKHGKKDIDILFTHYPPQGIFDIVRFKGENPFNRKHIGFNGYIKFIKKYKPRLVICGHMHEYQGKKKFRDTLIVTTGAAKDGKAAIIDIPEKKGKIKVKFIK